MIKSAHAMEVVRTPLASFGGSVAEGAFSVPEDRHRLCGIAKRVLREKLERLLRSESFTAYRALLNLQTFYLRGSGLELIDDLVPGFRNEKDQSEVSKFLYENGLSSLREWDGAAWTALHYAALGGSASLVEALLLKRADPNSKTGKLHPQLGIPSSTSALSIAIFFRNNAAAQCLLAYRARVDEGAVLPSFFAAMGDNAGGVRLLCHARAEPRQRDFFGFSVLDCSVGFGSMEATEELIRQSGTVTEWEATRALFCACDFRGGSEEMVKRFVSLRAEVNARWRQGFLSAHGIYVSVLAWQYRCGKRSTSCTLSYHSAHATPLIFAVIAGEYEAAVTLLANRADPHARNRRQRSALDLAHELGSPAFVMEAMEDTISF